MSLTVIRRSFRVAELGARSPLPSVARLPELPYPLDDTIPDDIAARVRYGTPRTLYPYREQSDYGRALEQRELVTIVLENTRLRAVFLPGLGGRLWELFDKQSGKQLLHSPDTVQFANLGLLGAWFAGGIEWNSGTRGHSPLSCSPMHAARVSLPNGQEALRLWEFDRLREVVIQLDSWLPPDSAALFVAIRIINPNETEVPMYWWTNAAVPQRSGTRVLAPAVTAFATDYGEGISRVTPTSDGGVDCTWPERNPRARDFFFDLAPAGRRWILGCDTDGDGLAMISSERLRGRKLFVWGNGDGGKQWQRWLTPDGDDYAEIQAGLAQTQYEHLPMPPDTRWSWVEAYGNASLDPAIATGDWETAITHGGARVDALVAPARLAEAETEAELWSRLAPSELLHCGTGWGALESARRRQAELPWIDETPTPFAFDAITEEQRPWLELLDRHSFGAASSSVAGASWLGLLESAEPNVQTLLQRAVMAHAAGDLNAARSLYAVSLAAEPTVIAHRGRGMLALEEGDVAEGLRFYSAACALDPGNAWLVVEASTAALEAAVPARALEFIADFWRARPTGGTPRDGRIRLLEARAEAADGHAERAANILRAGLEVADLREGENGVADLWRAVLPAEPVPAEYEFSMLETGGAPA